MALVTLGIGCSAEKPLPPPTVGGDPLPGVTEPTRDTADDPAEEIAAAEAAFRTMTEKNPDPEAWREAEQKLKEIGAAALPVLLDGLKSDSQMTREMASSVLAQFGVEAVSAAESLTAALEDDSTWVRANLATALMQMPDHVEEVVPIFVQILVEGDVDLRRSAATNLRSMDAQTLRPFLPQLIAALDDADRDVVYQVTQLLGRCGSDAADALPKLRSLDSTGDRDLSSAIATAIRLIDSSNQPE